VSYTSTVRSQVDPTGTARGYRKKHMTSSTWWPQFFCLTRPPERPTSWQRKQLSPAQKHGHQTKTFSTPQTLYQTPSSCRTPPIVVLSKATNQPCAWHTSTTPMPNSLLKAQKSQKQTRH